MAEQCPYYNVCKAAIAYYGEPAQVLKCIEELAELQWELLESLEHVDMEGEEFMGVMQSLNSEMIDWVRGNIKPSSLHFIENHNVVGTIYELADVSITTKQMRMIFDKNNTEFIKAREYKLNRLAERMNGDGDSQ